MCQQTLEVVYHEDTWTNKKFSFPKFTKRPNAHFALMVMKAMGWTKQIGLK